MPRTFFHVSTSGPHSVEVTKGGVPITFRARKVTSLGPSTMGRPEIAKQVVQLTSQIPELADLPPSHFRNVVVGGGPAGYAVTSTLLDGESHPTLWVDPAFQAGRLARYLEVLIPDAPPASYDHLPTLFVLLWTHEETTEGSGSQIQFAISRCTAQSRNQSGSFDLQTFEMHCVSPCDKHASGSGIALHRTLELLVFLSVCMMYGGTCDTTGPHQRLAASGQGISSRTIAILIKHSPCHETDQFDKLRC